jgi:hypothetical protein
MRRRAILAGHNPPQSVRQDGQGVACLGEGKNLMTYMALNYQPHDPNHRSDDLRAQRWAACITGACGAASILIAFWCRDNYEHRRLILALFLGGWAMVGLGGLWWAMCRVGEES